MKPAHSKTGMPAAIDQSRLAAADMARGLAMLLVVTMHAILGVEESFHQRGALHHLVEFATSFRVPAFFFIAGLFLNRAMRLSWADLFAKRVFGLILLYLIWLAIHMGLRSVPELIANPAGALFGPNNLFWRYAQALIEPYGLLWFIHLMIVFIIIARLVYAMPKLLPIVLLVTAGLETARITTDWTMIDAFAARSFYFFLGLAVAPILLPGGRNGPRPGVMITEPRWLTFLRERPRLILLAICVWVIAQIVLSETGLDRLRGLSLIAGLMGAAALLLIGLWLSIRAPGSAVAKFLQLMGERSIVIYLVFTIPMSMVREGLRASGLALPVDLVSLIVIISAILVSLAVERAVRDTRFAVLFERHSLQSGKP
jgi:uncharacterized membrane protein YcfT